MKVGYVMQKYPSLTLTFVYREVEALRAAGVQVDTFAIWKPRAGELSREALPFLAETFYVFPLNLLRFVASHMHYLAAHPRRYLACLAFCLRADSHGWNQRLRTFGHFLQAVYLAAEVERRGIQHLHAHFARAAATLAMLVARLNGITFSFTAHANDIFVAPTLLPEKLAAARFVIAISEYNRQFLLGQAPGLPNRAKLHVVHCGLDVRRFAAQTGAIPALGGAPLILGIGRLVEKKGFSDLVTACALLVQRGYAFRCEIVGAGPEQAALEQQIQTLGLAGCVRLAGAVFQERLFEHLRAAQIFAMPCVAARNGDMDGIPNTLMEAMALELPVVTTSLTGIPELVEHERTGLLVPPGNVPALAQALARLLDDAALRARLGRAGRAKVVAEFEIEKNTQALLRIFSAELPPAAAPAQPEGSAYSEVLG